jgi:cell division protein FtsQ
MRKLWNDASVPIPDKIGVHRPGAAWPSGGSDSGALVIAAIRQGATLSDGSGRRYFQKLDKNDESDLPILTGFYQEGKLNELLLKNARTLINDLSTSKYFPTIDSVSEIQGNESFWYFSLYRQRAVSCPGNDDYGKKLQRLSPISRIWKDAN